MKIIGIICEYNPFHNGHKYLLEEAKKQGGAVVSVMSGSYTQRGEMAIADKYSRAECALRCGADLVLELPFPYCASSAEFFAKGGVSVLERIGADAICFGSESGELELLKKAAAVAADPEFIKIKNELPESEGSAKGYFDALSKALGLESAPLSNDILGIEYIKEINRRELSTKPETVKRVGDGYRDSNIASSFASATAIRRFLYQGDFSSVADCMPSESLLVLKEAYERGDAPTDPKNIESAILAFWRTVDPEDLADIAELGNGLEYRIRDAALKAVSLDELYSLAATKKYTDARIRRAVLFGMLGVKKSDLDAEPEYTFVLGASERGRELLSKLRKTEGEMKIVTKPADAPRCRQAMLSERADALFTLAMPTPREGGYLFKKKIYIS